TVYLARDPEGARIALKCIHPQMAEREDLVAMFVDEARIASRIAHPNVCRVLDFGTADGRPFIAMEYLEGATVSAILRAIARSTETRATQLPAHAARIVSDACRGLHAAHELCDEQGESLHVVHRDVTIRNVLVGYDGRVSVLDFGIARAADQIHETRTGVVKGTLTYMSPEQIRRKAIDRRSDVWSVGIVLWEMLTGRSLFRRRTDLDALVAIERGQIPKPSQIAAQVPPELDDIALRALERDRDARWATAAELADALDHVLAGLPDAPDERALGAWARALVPPPRVSSAAVPVPRSSDARRADPSAETNVGTGESDPGSDPAVMLPAWDPATLFGDGTEAAVPRKRRAERDGRGRDGALSQASTRLLGDGDALGLADAAPPSVEPVDTSTATPSPPDRAVTRTPMATRGSLIAVAIVAGVTALAAIGFATSWALRDDEPQRTSTTLAALRAEPIETVGRAPVGANVPTPTSTAIGTTASSSPLAATPTTATEPTPATPAATATASTITSASTSTSASATTSATTPTQTSAPTPVSATAPGDSRDDRVGLGTLRVVYVGGWATVSVDGRTLGSSPVQVRLPAGRHSVALLPMGRPPAVRRSVMLRQGSTMTVRVVRETAPD
ncbi:MAG: protein kinase, partial [Deltaproteobacteria bacterium]|nr:protein kinase [Deltaproteobacteria bacterium]